VETLSPTQPCRHVRPRASLPQEDLKGYLNLRSEGLARKTIIWLKKAAELLWNATKGIVSISALQNLRNHVLAKYRDTFAKRKVLQFSRAFLRYMSKTCFDERYAAFDLFLQLPRSVKEQKRVTERIVTKEDIENVLTAIGHAYRSGSIDADHYLNYKAMVLLGAFTGQRPLATIARLKVGQLRNAVKMEKPVWTSFRGKKARLNVLIVSTLLEMLSHDQIGSS
jgi:integrase